MLQKNAFFMDVPAMCLTNHHFRNVACLKSPVSLVLHVFVATYTYTTHSLLTSDRQSPNFPRLFALYLSKCSKIFNSSIFLSPTPHYHHGHPPSNTTSFAISFPQTPPIPTPLSFLQLFYKPYPRFAVLKPSPEPLFTLCLTSCLAPNHESIWSSPLMHILNLPDDPLTVILNRLLSTPVPRPPPPRHLRQLAPIFPLAISHSRFLSLFRYFLSEISVQLPLSPPSHLPASLSIPHLCATIALAAHCLQTLSLPPLPRYTPLLLDAALSASLKSLTFTDAGSVTASLANGLFLCQKNLRTVHVTSPSTALISALTRHSTTINDVTLVEIPPDEIESLRPFLRIRAPSLKTLALTFSQPTMYHHAAPRHFDQLPSAWDIMHVEEYLCRIPRDLPTLLALYFSTPDDSPTHACTLCRVCVQVAFDWEAERFHPLHAVFSQHITLDIRFADAVIRFPPSPLPWCYRRVQMEDLMADSPCRFDDYLSDLQELEFGIFPWDMYEAPNHTADMAVEQLFGPHAANAPTIRVSCSALLTNSCWERDIMEKAVSRMPALRKLVGVRDLLSVADYEPDALFRLLKGCPGLQEVHLLAREEIKVWSIDIFKGLPCFLETCVQCCPLLECVFLQREGEADVYKWAIQNDRRILKGYLEAVDNFEKQLPAVDAGSIRGELERWIGECDSFLKWERGIVKRILAQKDDNCE